jgi:hypothetical protein
MIPLFGPVELQLRPGSPCPAAEYHLDGLGSGPAPPLETGRVKGSVGSRFDPRCWKKRIVRPPEYLPREIIGPPRIVRRPQATTSLDQAEGGGATLAWKTGLGDQSCETSSF